MNIPENDELLDLVNKEDQVIGTVLRSEAHKNPALIHRGTALIIINSNKDILMTQRSNAKPSDPGRWVVASSGHLKAGQDPIEAVAQEAYEELGITVKPLFVTKNWIFDDHERMIYYVCYAVHDNDDIVLDKKESAQYKWVPLNEFEAFCNANKVDEITRKMTIEVIQKVFK